MYKKITTAVVGLAFMLPNIATADISYGPSVAVIDTALDTSIPLFKDRIIYEVCILEYNSCANKKNFMEGPGSAAMPINQMKKNGFEHGTQMVSALLKTNKNANIVFIRIAGANSMGMRQPSSEVSFARSLDWIASNKDKFNIQAVVMSQGHHNLNNAIDYCPKTISTKSRIKKLLSYEIPVFLPTGNKKDNKRIDWPSCIDESISVGSSSLYEDIAPWTNIDINKVDFYTIGVMKLINPGNTESIQLGTSISAQVAAANWLALKENKPSYTYQQLYDTFKKTSISIYSQDRLKGDMMYLEGAING